MKREILAAVLCVMIAMPPLMLADSTAAPAADVSDAVGPRALGGLWNPDGPRESGTCHIISPQTLLASNPGVRPSYVDNSAGLPPVGNQLSQGSCTCWAIGYYHATYIENRESPINLADPKNQTSPAFLYNIANGGVDGGSTMEDVADLLISNGACSMAEKPYHSSDCTSWPAEDWMWVSGMKRRAVSQNWLDLTGPGGMDALKAYLSAGNTATTGIEVYGNFDNIEEYNYTYCSSECTGYDRGGHVVTIVGYDDDKPTADGMGAFWMVNSWGTDWGQAGFWWMSYEAMVDYVLGCGWAMYLESESVGYEPRLVAKMQIDHESRGDIIQDGGLSISVTSGGDYLMGASFLSCYWMEDWMGTSFQLHPFPDGKMAFDLTEALEYMDDARGSKFTLYLGNSQSLSGELLSYEVLNAEWWEGNYSVDAPMPVVPLGYTQTEAVLSPGVFRHLPMRMDGDEDLAHAKIGEFLPGDGTPAYPYVLHDYTIDGAGLGNCVYIGNTTAAFSISNCTLYGASSAVWSDWYADSSILLSTVDGGAVEGNRLNGSYIGAFLMGCSGTVVQGNEMTGNADGMDLPFCTGVVVRENNVADNFEYGICVAVAEGNSIYHNNIIGNPIQGYDDCDLNPWDSGYPEGGNYWSDYAGQDLLSGPGQDQPGSDGIGDTPYTNIDGGMGARDNYPLMEPWGETEIGPVHNIDSGEYFDAIQAAIDDAETIDGHTIEIAAGTYREIVVIDKSLTLLGEYRDSVFINCSGMDSTGITIHASNVQVQNFTIEDCFVGLRFGGIQSSVRDCIFKNNEYGVSFDGLGGYGDNNTLENCDIDASIYWGIYYADNADWNVICGCNFTNNPGGIDIMGGSQYNEICNNNILGCSYSSISIGGASRNNIIYHNNFINNSNQATDEGGNFWDDGYPSGGNYWSDYAGPDVMSDPLQDQPGSDGIGDVPYASIAGGTGAQDNYPLMEPLGESESGPVHNVNKNLYYQTIQEAIDDAEPDNLIVASPGIYSENIDVTIPLTLKGAPNQTIIDAGGISTGIYVASSNVAIIDFIIRNTGTADNPSDYYEYDSGVEICDVNNVTVRNCTFIDIPRVGIFPFKNASNCTITGCTFNDVHMNAIRFQSSGMIGKFYGNVIERNTFIAGFYGVVSYGTEMRDTTITSNSFDHCAMGGISFNQVGYNFWAGSCSFNSITNNVITCPGANAIYVGSSYDRRSMMTVSGNNITGATYITYTTDLLVYHNNFFIGSTAYDDGTNLWDDGYPSGGNYWSDYTGADMFSGPGQDIPGSDGIGDTPKTFTSNQDNYPLMEPWAPPAPETFSVNLAAGWNLISIPLVMADASVENVLASIAGQCDAVKWYDARDVMDPWKSYRPGGTANDLASIDNVIGIWVHVTANCTLTVQGEAPAPASIPLRAGWNLVGYPSLTGRAVADAFWGTSADRVEAFDAASTCLISAMGSVDMMGPGNGYWVHVVADSVWTVGW